MRSTIVTLLTLVGLVMGVKKQDFKRCDQSGFCYRSRVRALSVAKGFPSPIWVVNEKSIVFNGKTGELTFALQKDQIVLGAKVSWLEDGRTLRLQVDEEGGKRYKIPDGDVISKDLMAAEGIWVEQRPECPNKRVYSGANLFVHLELNPFKITVLQDEEAVVTLNAKGLFNVESEPVPKFDEDFEAEQDLEDPALEDLDDDQEEVYQYQAGKQFGMPPTKAHRDTEWGKNVDSMPKGRQSLSMDIKFNTAHLYGLPEHTTGLNLISTLRLVPFQDKYNLTTLDEPYRLYNLDVFEYELDSTMALYGAVPFVLGGRRAGVGAFWNNPSETWVDVVEAADEKGRSVLFTSESGVIDLFLVIADPKQDNNLSKQVLGRYAEITGFPMLPPQFALGYHQCRWNYKTQQDLLSVHANFDTYKIPVDVLWLDIEHTEGKRYFTWDSRLFPEPEEMQKVLEQHGRHLVNIVDPHIKVDEKYRVYQELKEKNLAVLSPSKTIFNGHCWPGDSVWADFADPEARDWWASQFRLDTYLGSTMNLHIWNDMNEPSVFNGPEITMPKDNLHMKGTVEHRDLHNLYGQMMHRATYEGLRRRNHEERPFVLSRAFYAGTQKYGAIWTGDNDASWSHLKASIPMLLSLSVAGIPFVGADVGGFFNNPEPELLVRWYQTGALYPFFRAHAHIDTNRREPWMFDEPYLSHIRDAIRLRYQLLPYIYTTMYEATITGVPVMRPMFMEADGMESVDDQFMLGSALLHKPVTQAKETSVTVSLPSESIWYDYFSLAKVEPDVFSNRAKLPVELETIPLLIAGGSIVPLKLRQRRSSRAMIGDPFTLLVALDAKRSATGTVFIDDGVSYNHEIGAACYMRLSFEDNQLSCKPSDSFTLGLKSLPKSVSTKVETIVVAGFTAETLPSSAVVIVSTWSKQEKVPVALETDKEMGIIRVRMPPVLLSSAWTIYFF